MGGYRGRLAERRLHESREPTAGCGLRVPGTERPVHHASGGVTAKCLKLTLCPLNSIAFQRALPARGVSGTKKGGQEMQMYRVQDQEKGGGLRGSEFGLSYLLGACGDAQ